MKQLFFPALALLSVVFSGCDRFNDKRYSTTVPVEFLVSVTDNAGALDIALDRTLTSLVNQALAEHQDAIKSYELVQFRYKIWEYSGDPSATFAGTLGIGNQSASTPGVTYAFNDISLSAGVADPAKVVINFTSADIDKIEQYFLDTDGLRLFLSGNVSHAPMTFLLQVEVDIDAITEEK